MGIVNYLCWWQQEEDLKKKNWTDEKGYSKRNAPVEECSNISASDIRDWAAARYRFRFDYYLPVPRNPWGRKVPVNGGHAEENKITEFPSKQVLV